MNTTAKILLIDETIPPALWLESALHTAGYQVIARLATSKHLFNRASTHNHDILILNSYFIQHDLWAELKKLNQEKPCAVVIFSNDDSPEAIQASVAADVCSYIVRGLDAQRLRPILEIAVARFSALQQLRQELSDTQHKLAERKDIERAKGLLMQQRGWSEQEAYQALRKKAMNQGVKLADIAKQVISVTQISKD